jgi:hypothetical protein
MKQSRVDRCLPGIFLVSDDDLNGTIRSDGEARQGTKSGTHHFRAFVLSDKTR